MTLAELRGVLGLDVSTLNRQTAALLRADLAERTPDPDGGLARKFRISPEGERRLSEERESNRATIRMLLADWPEEEIERFADALVRFNGAIEARSGRHWPGHAPATPRT